MILPFFQLLSSFTINYSVLPNTYADISPISDRITKIGSKCLDPIKKAWDYTLKDRTDLIGGSKDLEKMYHPSQLTKLATESVNAITTELLGGRLAQTMFHEAYSVEDTVEIVAKSLRDFADKNGLNELQIACTVGCSLNVLLNGREDVIWGTSTELALILGTGQCKHFAYAGDMIFKKLGLETKPVYSTTHAFFSVKDPETGAMLTYDPMGSDVCEFFKP